MIIFLSMLFCAFVICAMLMFKLAFSIASVFLSVCALITGISAVILCVCIAVMIFIHSER